MQPSEPEYPAFVTALARQLARQQQVIAERDAEIARLRARVAKLEEERVARFTVIPYPKVETVTLPTADLKGVTLWSSDHATE